MQDPPRERPTLSSFLRLTGIKATLELKDNRWIHRATGGTSAVSFEYDFTYLEFFYQYGITDKLTAGAMIPFMSPEYPAGSPMISESLKTKNPQSFLNTGAVVWSSGR